MTQFDMPQHLSADKMHIKWESDSPAMHHIQIGYETPPPHAPLSRPTWPLASGTTLDHAFSDFHIGLARSPSTMSTASTPQSSYHDQSLSALQSCCTSAPSLPTQAGYDINSHCIKTQSRGLSSWQTPMSSSPCSLMDVRSQDFIDPRQDSAQAYPEWAPMVSPTFSTNSLINLSTSPANNSPTSSNASMQWQQSMPWETFMDVNDFGQRPLGSATSMPQVPTLQSSIEPPFLFNDLSTMDAASRQMLGDYSYHQQISPDSMSIDNTGSQSLLLPVRGRARKPARGRARSQGSKKSVTRNAVTRRGDGAFVVPAAKGKGNVEIYREDDGKWTNPAPKRHRHYCDFSNHDMPCTASFARKEHLTRHQSKHSNNRPWACPLLERVKNTGKIIPCRMTCSRHDNLMDHIGTHCRAWLARQYPEFNKTARRFEVSIVDAERLIIEDQCGDDPDEESLREVKLKLRQLTRRLKKSFPGVPEEVVTFPMLRGEEE